MLVADLQGLWRRSLLAFPDGRRDVTTVVHWLQGRTYYADLRQPEGRPDFSGVDCLRRLQSSQLTWMARQEAFAGALMLEQGMFHWLRDIDLQPRSPYPDSGRLRLEGDMLIEEGAHIDYVEHWRREPGTSRPNGVVALVERNGLRRAFILRSGPYFMFARGPLSTPGHDTLRASLEAATSLHGAQDLVDCEVSFGELSRAGWRITRSSLPFKEGRAFVFRREGDVFSIEDLSAEGANVEVAWRIGGTDGDMDCLESGATAQETET